MTSLKEKQENNVQIAPPTIVKFEQQQDERIVGDWDYWRYLEVFVSEFTGTGLLMAVGCMSTVAFTKDPVPVLQPGLTFGLVVATLIQIFGHISAAHFNPAVTVCFYMLGHVTTVAQVLNYVIAEILGAVAGLMLLKVLSPSGGSTCLCCTQPAPSLNDFQGLGVEIIATSCLIFLVCSLTDPRNADKQDSAPIKFGLLIAALSFAAGPYTGASMNPARSLAPAIVNNVWTAQWIYWLGPIAAGFIIPLFYKTIFCKNVNR